MAPIQHRLETRSASASVPRVASSIRLRSARHHCRRVFHGRVPTAERKVFAYCSMKGGEFCSLSEQNFPHPFFEPVFSAQVRRAKNPVPNGTVIFDIFVH